MIKVMFSSRVIKVMFSIHLFLGLCIFLLRIGFMVLNATFNNISVISWWSVLLVDETGVPGENHRPVASHWQTLSNNVVSSTYFHFEDLCINWFLHLLNIKQMQVFISSRRDIFSLSWMSGNYLFWLCN
jgi:hypothetical protein